MAANDYYSNTFTPQHSHDRVPFRDDYPQPTLNAPASPRPYGDPVSPSYDAHGGPYQGRFSQHSFTSDNGYYSSGGKHPGADQYAEDIPLKPNAQPPPQANDPLFMHQNTQYGPQMAMDPDLSGRPTRKSRRARFFNKKIAWVTYLLTIIDVGVFVGELIRSAQLTGSPIEIHPTFNPMIGPSPYVQINMGSRFVSCMKNIPGVQDATSPIGWPCPNSTSSDPENSSNKCTLSELCGFNGVPNPHVGGSLDDHPEPNQWFRFIVPMFLHAGIIHIGFNMLMQMTMGADMERNIGWWRFALVYFASGIFGFVMGGNYAAQGISSTGASGSLFGVIAIYLLDLLYTWEQHQRPWVDLFFIVLEILVSFVLGLLPGLDNFSHIGGFIMGLAMGLCMMRSPNYIRERIGLARSPYVVMSGGVGTPQPEQPIEDNDKPMRSGPMTFFQGRKGLWWAWWLVRIGALVAVIIGFILLVTDFYKYPSSNCSWCYHLSCLPVNNWCSLGNLQLTPT